MKSLDPGHPKINLTTLVFDFSHGYHLINEQIKRKILCTTTKPADAAGEGSVRPRFGSGVRL